MKRRTEITFEMDRVMVTSKNAKQIPWCEICGKEVSMATVSDAAKVLHTSEWVTYGFAVTGRLHFSTSTGGQMMICLDSVLAFLESERPSPSGRLLISESQNKA